MYEKSEQGIWLVEGEDQSNGGFWDTPQIPRLGYFEGKYGDVLKRAQQWKRWKSWGRGGTITKIEITKLK